MLNKLELLWNSSTVTKIPLVDDEQYDVTPQTASFEIYDPGGSLYQSSTSATISGSYIQLTFPATTRYEQSWRIAITATSGSQTWYLNQYVDTVKTLLVPLLRDDDLFDAYPWLSDKKWTGESDWRRQKQLAWDELFLSIKSRGFRPALMAPSSEELRQAHLNLTLANIFRGMFQEVGDKWHNLYELHYARYSTTFEQAMASLKYDSNEDMVAEKASSMVALDLYR